MSNRAIIGLAVLGCLAAVLGFRLVFEPVEIEIDVGLRGAAQRDPLLAAERFLVAMGKTVGRNAEDLETLPASAVVLLADSDYVLSNQEFEALTDWVEGGGTLIAAAQPRLAEWAEVPLVAVDGSSNVVTIAVASEWSRNESQKRSQVEPFDVWMPDSPRFGEPETEAMETVTPGVFLQGRMGQGRLLLLSSSDFLTNERIGGQDHAEFLFALVKVRGTSSAQVLLLSQHRPPSLIAVLASRAWMALLAGALLIVLWAWRVGSRVGPILDREAPARRSVLEHIRGTANLLWRVDEREALLAGLRSAVAQRAARRHPGWKALPRRQQIERMASVSKIPGGLLIKALNDPAPSDAPTFTHMVRQLDSVWRSL